jgi:hypothetical protein
VKPKACASRAEPSVSLTVTVIAALGALAATHGVKVCEMVEAEETALLP